MTSAGEALARLREGNRRFVSGAPRASLRLSALERAAQAQAQAPFAIVLGCSDSRVPAEIVFDQGPGDLFVIRVAGNVVAPSQVGSVEFAAGQFGTRLVVVLGHSGCGAVQATIGELRQQAGTASPNLRSIVDRIRPAVQDLLEADPGIDDATLLRRGVRANVRAAAGHLRHGSRILEDLSRDAGLVVAGAEYSLETGVVDFFDLPAALR